MKSINRNVVIIKPKEPFLDWLKGLSDPMTGITVEELRRDCMAFLIPETISEKEAFPLIRKHWKIMFESELMAWHRDEQDWPQNRTAAMFRKWFDLEYHSEVIDLVDMPIEKEDYFVV